MGDRPEGIVEPAPFEERLVSALQDSSPLFTAQIHLHWRMRLFVGTQNVSIDPNCYHWMDFNVVGRLACLAVILVIEQSSDYPEITL
jgi:hypothetical protein